MYAGKLGQREISKWRDMPRPVRLEEMMGLDEWDR